MALAQLRESLDNYGCHTAKSQLDDKLTDGMMKRLQETNTAFSKVRGIQIARQFNKETRLQEDLETLLRLQCSPSQKLLLCLTHRSVQEMLPAQLSGPGCFSPLRLSVLGTSVPEMLLLV